MLPDAEPEAGVLMLNTRLFRTPCAAPPAVPLLKHVSSQLIVRGLCVIMYRVSRVALSGGERFLPTGTAETL